MDYSRFSSCESCIVKVGCGFCANTKMCVEGGWKGPLNQSACQIDDYYYNQCRVSTLSIETMIVITILLCCLMLIFYFFRYRRRTAAEDDENRHLLDSHNSLLRRTSTYYQWNKAPVPPNNNSVNRPSSVDDFTVPRSSTEEDQQVDSEDWEDRREAILKKYARQSSIIDE
ncbi:MAG: hypothetical protein EXX96DRAFT_254109 [Benjaminiella poitrasii]|nr:MAG: hypothetical protein EXX96DRAFT_254109 [Benjaminiella poitrasii]